MTELLYRYDLKLTQTHQIKVKNHINVHIAHQRSTTDRISHSPNVDKNRVFQQNRPGADISLEPLVDKNKPLRQEHEWTTLIELWT